MPQTVELSNDTRPITAYHIQGYSPFTKIQLTPYIGVQGIWGGTNLF